MLHALYHVPQVDGDVLVSVRPTLFMEEAHGMHQLMQDSNKIFKLLLFLALISML